MEPDNSLVPSSSKGVTRKDFEEVIRRATELAQDEGATAGTDISEAELFRIAAEVGLSGDHVRRALVEVRQAPPVPTGVRALWSDAWITASRVVPGSKDAVATSLDEFLVSSRLLQQVRQGPEHLVYWPSEDWASQIARVASSTGRKYYIASAKRVEVILKPATEGSTWVELRVDPGMRNDSLAGALIGGGVTGAGAGVAVAVLVASAAPLVAGVAAGVALGGAVFGGISSLVARGYRNQVERVKLEMEGVLDQLERGEIPEPPPSSWRRWVSRNFRGIAREISRETGSSQR